MKPVKILIALLIAVIAVICFAPQALAFCGFYVAKADTKLYNQASQVVIARNGDRNIITMANDYQGEVKDFALVVPVPVVLEKEQVNVGDSKIIERLDGFSAPRLVEYFDPNPCISLRVLAPPKPAGGVSTLDDRNRKDDEALGITIEAQFTVGEYDILILSAKESNGLETWLKQNDYQIPSGASRLLQTYIRQGMKFFVAKVNLAEFEKTGYQLLRPLQMAYESPRFMLPIRLGMINGKSAQDLVVYILSPEGQVEITNYRTVKVPSDSEIPLFVKSEFGDFYKSMFQKAYEREGKKVAFMEYAWNMAWCDPCAAEPLSNEELKKAGVFWLNPNTGTNVFITRLHVRYSRDKFPEDLIFQETSNTEQFQGRYVLRHPFAGEMDCKEGENYQKSLPGRYEDQAQTLAKLTGWKIKDIRDKMNLSQSQSEHWWNSVFP
ncbi:DUF2330 domain-containing protein [Limnofasciculus baicalensis]|uniref:DUF2330 domain-containing protein n=1 Tax=Limnofasciculus baicalensis BBK-W-15 TaxID=2699891 RepID=A0AAE3KNK5_9CYAN|nr:DUF2330 domain-containing protein [Limnofasciculus baicalensis]MCP2730620.1 DUF2330 domain-containing protein [Limnofasciculus baicalensis BBK-W-15]